MKHRIIVSAIVTALTLSTGFAMADMLESAQKNIEKQAKEQVNDSELLTQEERAEHSSQMRAAKSAEEREQIIKEHRELIQERADAQGATMPDDLPASAAGIESEETP